MGYSKMFMLVTILMVISCTKKVTEAQENPSCAQKLVSCVDYLNSTHPSANCCTALKEVVEKERVCLCNLYNTPGLFESLNINITQALLLPQNCGVSGNVNVCTNGTAQPPSSLSPPGVPGGDSGADRIAWTGFSGLLLFGVSMILY